MLAGKVFMASCFTISAFQPEKSHTCSHSKVSALIAFYVFDANAGHDYGTIETKGYHHIVCDIDGEMKVLDNPRW